MKNASILAVMVTLAIFVTQAYAGRPDPYVPQVEVVNEPTVHIGTIPSVNVGNEPTVHVGSMPTAVEREPFQRQVDRGFSGGIGITYLFYTVPPDKRLVIEFVSTGIDLSINYDVRKFDIQIDDGTNKTIHFTPPLVEVYNDVSLPGARYQGSQKVLIHANPDDEVFVHFDVNQGGGTVTSSTTMSGYLVPVPTP
jgi:hypothetical protein